MDKKKVKNLLDAVQRIGIKNYFDEDDRQNLLVPLQELIASLEQSEDLVSAEQLADAIKAFFADRSKDGELPEEVQNTIRKAVRDMQMPNLGAKSQGYLDTIQAVRDFRNSIVTARNSEQFLSNWKGHLTKNGITGIAYPTQVGVAIANNWRESDGLFARMTKVGSKAFKLPYTLADNADPDVLAKGHVKGELKTQQSFEVAYKALDLQMIYKWIPIDRLDLVAMEDDAAFIDWIVRELSDRLAYTIERQVIVGGVQTGTDAITSLESIGAKTTSDAWTKVTSVDPSSDPFALSIYSAVFNTEGRNRWLYIARDLTTPLLVDGKDNLGNGFYTIEQIKQMYGIEKIIPYDFPRAGATPVTGEIAAVVISPEDYYRVGGEPFGEQWSIYEKNQEGFMAEIAMGGGVGKMNSSAVVLIA